MKQCWSTESRQKPFCDVFNACALLAVNFFKTSTADNFAYEMVSLN